MMARTEDPDTSHDAAESLDSAAMERLVYETIARFPNGCIADEIERALPHVRSHSITPRFAPLLRKGFIIDTGERRLASSGRNQRVVRVIKSEEQSDGLLTKNH
jgi:hypothetical protein